MERTRKPIEIIEEAERQWIYTEDDLLRTPSICDGLAPEQEKSYRQKGFNFITQVGVMLKLPQTTLSTASVFFNRFLMRYSLQTKSKEERKLHHYQVAAVALFLATKVEEHCRKVRELVIACCRVAQKNPNLVVDENTKDYWKWRDTILHHEDLLLEVLCFDLTVESPYNNLFTVLQYYGVEKQKKLRDAAWAFINDSHLTQACLLFTSRTIACAALWFAAKQSGHQFSDDDKGRPWWEVQKVPLRYMRRALEYMANFYDKPPAGVTLKGHPPGSESVYAGLKSSPAENGEDPALNNTRLQNSVTPMLMTPDKTDREQRSGSEGSTLGKRRREDEVAAATTNGDATAHANGVLPILPGTNGIGSRIPAAARQMMNGEENPTKKQRTGNGSIEPPSSNGIGPQINSTSQSMDPSANGISQPITTPTEPATFEDDAGSEEGEVEE